MSHLLVAPLLWLTATTGEVVDTSDCERVAEAFPHQAAAAWSSLAFVVVGLWIVARYGWGSDRRRWLPMLDGGLVALAGLGSFAYHGFGGEAGRWVHDASFLVVLLFVAVWDQLPVGRWSPTRTRVLGFVGVALAAAVVVPAVTNVALAGLSMAIGVTEVRAWPQRPSTAKVALRWAGAVLGVAVVIYVLGRTGGPACDPDSLVQGHAVWHLLTAITAGLWARAAFGSSSGETVEHVVGDAGGGIDEG